MEKPILAAMLSVAGTKLSDNEKRILEQANPLGITIFGRNIESKRQLQNLITEVKTVIGRDDVLIGVDQEGGRIRRLAEPEFRAYAAQAELGQIEVKFGQQTAEKTIRSHAALISEDLHETGINLNYAPVLDIAYPETSSVLKSRCFGADEKKTASYGSMMIDEYQKAGICPCIKHMPGHGRATVDPHLALPVLNFSLNELQKDFYPFIQNRRAAAGMTAHILLPEIDDKLPVTQSVKAIDKLIRGIIGFDGFLISDAIDMHALKGTIAERASLSIRAGVDAVCCCSGRIKDLTAVCGERCFMTEKSLQRYANIKKVIHNKPKCVDVKNIELQYKEKIGSILNVKCSYDATEVLHQMLKKGES